MAKMIVVPHSDAARKRLDTDVASENELITFNLNEDAFEELWNSHVFDALNTSLGILIDDYEDESIEGAEQLARAEQIVARLAKGMRTNGTLRRLREMIVTARDKNTGIFFYF